MAWRRRVLWLLVAAGLVAGMPDLAARLRAEAADRTVQLVADQAAFAALARTRHTGLMPWLQRLHRAGVGALGVSEDTLGSLAASGQIAVFTGAQWRAARCASGAPAALPLPPSPGGVYVWTHSRSMAQWLEGALRQALRADGAVHVTPLPGAAGQFIVAAPSVPIWRAIDLPLGFGPTAFRAASRLGMDAVPRPVTPASGLSPAGASAVYREIARAGVRVDALVFAGPVGSPVPGFPRDLPAVTRTLRERGWALGLVETPQQLGNVDHAGMAQLSAALGQRDVRVYGVPAWQLQQAPGPNAVAAVVDAVRERNLRLVYIEPVTSGPDPLAASVEFCAQLAAALRADGYALGPPHPLPLLRVSPLQLVLQAAAAAAAGLVLLELLWPGIRVYGYQPLAVTLAVVGGAWVGSPRLATYATALGAACVSGGLAGFVAATLWRRKPVPAAVDAGPRPRWGAGAEFAGAWRRGAWTALAMAAVTLGGALVIATVLGDTDHMLEWHYYRGVKLTYVAIPCLAAAAYVRMVGTDALRDLWTRRRQALRRLRAAPARVKFAYVARFGLIAAVVVAAFALYLSRSGNVNASSMLSLELHMRQWLSSHLIYRPREKEFLVGYPSAFLAAFFALRRRTWAFLAFLLGASVAPVSVVDTFAHIRTPLAYSWWRECVGLGLGLLVGSALLLACVVAARALPRLRAAWHAAATHPSVRNGLPTVPVRLGPANPGPQATRRVPAIAAEARGPGRGDAAGTNRASPGAGEAPATPSTGPSRG